MSATGLKAVVLISGSGSNLKALINAVSHSGLELDIVRVISNRANAGGLVYAHEAGIPVSVIPHQEYSSRETHDRAILEVLEKDQPELIILAGYMRILSESFAQKYSHCMINLHPSLLPLYKGLDTYNRAIEAGDQQTGASIHMVTADLDDGPVIAQVQIPINAKDDATSLAKRLGPLEHKLLVATVREFCQQTLRYDAGPDGKGQLLFKGEPLHRPLQLQADANLILP
jgi:phosphoribosylglycinamide formyltransferase-1